MIGVSVVIVGGNECMSRQYTDVCRSYKCKAKLYLKTNRVMGDFGNPDLLILFTGTVSHKMVHNALSRVNENTTKIARSHSSSLTALKSIMDEHFGACPT